MNEIIPGLCFPELIFLLTSFSGLLLVLLNSNNRDANMMGFIIFVAISICSIIITSLCHINYIALSWSFSVISIFAIGYLVNNKYVGKIDLLEFAGMLISNIVSIVKYLFKVMRKIL
tara:strand:+ start:3104 stop:3454 length:351 start_codon:yes stop_codon:yes gene_type:complete